MKAEEMLAFTVYLELDRIKTYAVTMKCFGSMGTFKQCVAQPSFKLTWLPPLISQLRIPPRLVVGELPRMTWYGLFLS